MSDRTVFVAERTGDPAVTRLYSAPITNIRSQAAGHDPTVLHVTIELPITDLLSCIDYSPARLNLYTEQAVNELRAQGFFE